MIVPKLLNENNKDVKKAVEDMRSGIAREYEKTIYILQFLVCDVNDIADKIKENDYGLSEEDFAAMASIQRSYANNRNNVY